MWYLSYLTANMFRALLILTTLLFMIVVTYSSVNSYNLYQKKPWCKILLLVLITLLAIYAWRKCFTTKWDLPSFPTRDELDKNPKWAGYLKSVYGYIPDNAFPLDLHKFDLFYKSKLVANGIDFPDPSPMACPNREGDIFTNMSLTHDSYDWLWRKQTVRPVVSHESVEVVHSNDVMSCRFPNNSGYWMYRSKGSGNVYNVGRTQTFKTHEDAQNFFGLSIRDPAFYEKAGSIGLKSIQFTHHDDMKCGNTALEIVDIKGKECITCLDSVKSGWNGQYPCECDSTSRFLNCTIK
jgi:hypothetical protein